MLSLLLALAAPALAAPQVECLEGHRVDVSSDLITVYDGLPYAIWIPWELGIGVQATWGSPAWADVPCLRLGVRNQTFVDMVFLDPTGPESGWELQDKLGPVVGGGAGLGRFELSGFIWPGVRITHVQQRADYPDVGVVGRYGATGIRPTLYLHSVLRVRIVEGLHAHLDGNWAPLFPAREYGWYANRVLGIGLSASPRR